MVCFFQLFDISSAKVLLQPVYTICFALGVLLVCTGIDQLCLLTTQCLDKRFENLECMLFDKAKGLLKRRIPAFADNNT